MLTHYDNILMGKDIGLKNKSITILTRFPSLIELSMNIHNINFF